jgi:hypothetical protein
MNVKNVVFSFLLSISLLIFASGLVFAESADVSALVGDTAVNLSGYVSPGAVVTFLENDAVTGTTTADLTGFFSKQFFSQNAGVHLIQIYSTDLALKTSITVDLNYVLVLGQSVLISDLYLPPTINVSSNEVKKGQAIGISGYAAPDKVIRIEFSGQEGHVYYEKSDPISGYYSKQVSSNDFSIGKYHVKSKIDFTSNVSTESELKDFQILESAATNATTTITPTPRGSSSLTPTPTAPTCLFNFVNICFFDSTKKGFLSLERDIYLYVKNFQALFEKPSTTYFDINQDGVVDAKDLSIMFYYTKSNFQISSASVQTSGTSEVLGEKSEKLEVESTLVDNGIMGNLLTLITLEVAIGLPFLLLAILLIVCWRRYAKR